MSMLNRKCDRCGKETNMFKMSFFNEDECCHNCILIEQMHDDYEHAREVETEHMKKGNYNYEGVGLPKDFEEWFKPLYLDFKCNVYKDNRDNSFYLGLLGSERLLSLNTWETADKSLLSESLVIDTGINSLEELEKFMFYNSLKYNGDNIKSFLY